jgi:hypothetical protein
MITNDDRCVCCGAYVPEGRQICFSCEKGIEQKEYKYLAFVEIQNHKGRSRIFECRNKRYQDVLGLIKWYPSWRQYCYFPTVQAVYSAGCLDDIANFIRSVNP